MYRAVERERQQKNAIKMKNFYYFHSYFTHLNKLGVVQPFESMPSPFYCREFLHAVHHHRPLCMEIERKT